MLGIMAVIVSGFLVTNVMNTIIVEQRKQIGMLKSLGATAKDTILIYTGIALIYGLVGSALGVALAIPAAALMAQSVGSAAFTYIDGFKISLRGIGIGFALGLLVPVVAAFFPVMSSIRVTILEAITDFGIASSWGKSRISRWIGGLPLPRLMVQALSNIYQKKGRLTLTGLTLTLAAAAFMGVSAVTQTLDSFVEGLFTSIKYELILSLQDGQNHEALTVLLSENFADIEGVYPGYSASVGIRGYESTDPLTEGSNQVSADGIDPANPAFAFNLREGSAWNADPARRGVVISRSLAENLDKTVGDSLTLTISGQDYDYEIIGVDNYAYDALYMNWRDLASLAGYVDANGVPLASTLYVDFKGDLSIKAVDDQKERIATFLRDRGMQVTFTNQPRAEQNQTQQISLFGVVFNMASGVMAAVGAVGLMAALSMAVFERQKEIGIMRSVGAGSFSILSQFLTEGVLIGALAWIGAAPLSVVVGLGLTQILPFDYLDFSYPPEVLGVGLVSILLLAGLASLLPAVAASRKTVADILRYQ
jgi:putative ABC transport system permease protein